MNAYTASNTFGGQNDSASVSDDDEPETAYAVGTGNYKAQDVEEGFDVG